jgi:iron-sulfur cluster assembly accessory protein
MNKLFSSITKFPIIVTNNAWNKMEDILKIKKYKGFIFSATSGGCNGFNYNLKVLDINKDKYNTYTTIKNNNVNILIEPISEIYLIGTTIDYVSEDFKNNIFENKFIFIPNKNIATSCGCGVSFNPKI